MAEPPVESSPVVRFRSIERVEHAACTSRVEDVDVRLVVHVMAPEGFDAIASQLRSVIAEKCRSRVEVLLLLPGPGGARWVGPRAPTDAVAVNSARAVERAARWLYDGESSLTRLYFVAGHGHGMDGVGGGDRRDAVRIFAIRDALRHARGGRVPLDVLGFDVCSMATWEIARELAGEARTMIASADLTPLRGWPMGRILDALEHVRPLDPGQLNRVVLDPYVEASRHHWSLTALRPDRAAAVGDALVELGRAAELTHCARPAAVPLAGYRDDKQIDPRAAARALTASCSQLPKHKAEAVSRAIDSATLEFACRDRGCALSPIATRLFHSDHGVLP